jgi:hypothetical protein
MDQVQIDSPNFNEFLQKRQDEILAIAQRNTEEIVKREGALMDFELLLSVNFPKKEQERFTQEGKKLRIEQWELLSKKFNNQEEKVLEFYYPL